MMLPDGRYIGAHFPKLEACLEVIGIEHAFFLDNASIHLVSADATREKTVAFAVYRPIELRLNLQNLNSALVVG